MPRFLSAHPDSRLLALPWSTPLEEWPTDLLVALPRGISRHVVRFIRVGEEVYAAKEVIEHLAVHEYRLLHDLRRLGAHGVEALAVVSGRTSATGQPLDPILLTRHLSFSLPYRSLFHSGVRQETVMRLIDALVVLLAQLHLLGFLWGDVSLSNVLFRRDADSFAAHLVDAETGELHEKLTDGQRLHDLTIAQTNLFGEFLDLEAGGLLDASLDPLNLVQTIENRYEELWTELTGVEEFTGSELHRIEGRVRRLNALGFDVAELDISTSPSGDKVRLQPKVVDVGHHPRRLLRLTGLDAEENQARRMLNDLDTYRARNNWGHMDEAVVAHRWLTECYEPTVATIPAELRGKRDNAQFFHEVLDHRWYQSQKFNREVPLTEAAHSYVNEYLAGLPDEALSSESMLQVTQAGNTPNNPYDPSKGFAEPTDEIPIYDPWEDEAEEVDPASASVLDIAALRAKAGDHPA
ncbi:DUF4032 domain-containing protein [Propionibacteriaceae bacterium Y1923]|uniref:DUF4032 domain-containing protein n=1 Tax=Aestuariimicrobium sp. Y1814 TaxID=3418742 RepID=UPI003C207063